MQIICSTELLNQILNLHDGQSARLSPSFQLQVFKALVNALQIVAGDSSLGHQSLVDLSNFSRIQTTILNQIQSSSQPFFFSDQITLDYFQSLMSLIGQNTEAFMSQIGVEFILDFTLHHHHQAGSGINTKDSGQTVSGKILTQLKKLLHFQKTRDAVMPIVGDQAVNVSVQMQD